MPHTDVIPTSASIASTGKGIRYLGKYCYAYSGAISVANTEVELLGFTAGSGVIVAQVQFCYPNTSTEDYQYTIKFNDEIIFSYLVNDRYGQSEPDNYINIVIPPLTQVSMTAANTTDTDARTQAVILTGRVYGAE